MGTLIVYDIICIPSLIREGRGDPPPRLGVAISFVNVHTFVADLLLLLRLFAPR